jgi:hypothetical protein
MWGSLLILPILAALSIFLLFNLNDNRLRRSLQFAIITSLALHLLVLVFASVINIFQNPYKPNERQVAQRPNRTIEISDQRASFVWEETNARETPEPKIETRRQEKPTTNVQPQPIPVEETQPQVNPQLVRRETTAQSVPRQNRELSKLRRQKRNLQPQSSQKVTGEKISENKTPPAASKSEQKAESAKQANSVAKQSAPQAEPSAEPTKSSAAPTAETKPEIAKATSSPRRTRSTETPTTSTPRPTPSTARVKRPTPRLPMASKKAPVTEKVATATSSQPTKNEPAKSASELTRRPVESRTIRPALTNRPKTSLSPRPQVAKTAQRKTQPQSLPSISSPTSVTITPRRSTTESAVVTSPVQLEKPARAPESKTASRQLNSKTLSVSRSSEGVAGVGRSKNLDRFTGGMNSPASRASDSARRERTQSNPADQRMLTSSQKSLARRSVGATRIPTSAFRSETTSAAKIAGAKTAGERTLESSAATIDAASSNNRDEVSAEKGSATVDMGATKIVTDRQTRRRSGGGQPEVSRLNPESTRRSKDRSSQQPSLVASTKADVSSPRNQSTAPPSANALEAASTSTFAARAGGESATTVERWSAQNAGELADQGQSNLAQQLSDSRQRARRSSDESSWNDDEDDEDEENKRGNQRTRIAQAPITRSDPGFGIADSDATAMAPAKTKGDGPSESVATKVSRQATASIPGSGIGRTASNILLQAATSLPIIEASPSRRSGTGNSKSTDASESTGVATNPKPRGARSTKSSVSPTIAGTATVESPTVSSRTGTSEAELDSVSVSIDKSNLAAMEQIQGSELDIDAIEGPAGLGDRPDNFIGVMTRPASRESEQLLPDMKNRFRSNRFGGMPAINPDAVIAKDAFRNRSPSSFAKASEPTTEAAIHLGLEFLARYQSPDGSWSLTGFDRDEPQHLTQLDSDTAATGLALLAFQGAGYNHREFKYARQINHAIQWLTENQAEDGGLYVPSDKKSDSACRLYSHGIAALALTEAYGMTQDPRLAEPAQKALDYIADSQDPRKGGWRYFDEPGKKSSDTSVSGWMMMAMQSGRLAGLEVDEKAFTSVDDWLEVAADPDNNSLYRYNPYARDSKGVSRMQGRKPTPSMTSVGLLMRIYSGWDKEDPRLLAGADYILEQQLPSDSTPQVRDTYYWYYATQVLKHIDGPRWEIWNQKLRPLLTRSQEKSGDFAGSWHPYRPVPDRWGSFGGRIYVTTMNLLSLEVRHRMLPLYQSEKQRKELQRKLEEKNKTEAPMIEGEIISTNIKPDADRASLMAKVVAPSAPTTPKLDDDLDRTNDPNSTLTRIAKTNVGENPNVEMEVPEISAPKIDLSQPAQPKPESTKPNLEKAGNFDSTAENTPDANSSRSKRTRSGITRAPKPAKIVPTVPLVEDRKPKESASLNAPNDSKSLTLKKPNSVDSKLEIKTLNKPNLAIDAPSMPDDIDSNLKRSTSEKLANAESDKSGSPTRPRSEKSMADAKPTIKPAETKPTPEKAKSTPKKPDVQFASVSGSVTLDGKILENAKVEFVPLDKNEKTQSVRTNKLGQFNIASAGTKRQPGLRVGKYKVSITTFFESPDENIIDLLETVPAKYNSATTLRATIVADKQNTLKIELQSK